MGVKNSVLPQLHHCSFRHSLNNYYNINWWSKTMSKIISTGNQTFNNNPIQKGKLQAQQMLLLFMKCVIVFAFLQLSKNVQSIRGRNVFLLLIYLKWSKTVVWRSRIWFVVGVDRVDNNLANLLRTPDNQPCPNVFKSFVELKFQSFLMKNNIFLENHFIKGSISGFSENYVAKQRSLNT